MYFLTYHSSEGTAATYHPSSPFPSATRQERKGTLSSAIGEGMERTRKMDSNATHMSMIVMGEGDWGEFPVLHAIFHHHSLSRSRHGNHRQLLQKPRIPAVSHNLQARLVTAGKRDWHGVGDPRHGHIGMSSSRGKKFRAMPECDCDSSTPDEKYHCTPTPEAGY